MTSPCGAGSTTLRRRTNALWSRSGALCSDHLAVGCDTGSERRDFGGRERVGEEKVSDWVIGKKKRRGEDEGERGEEEMARRREQRGGRKKEEGRGERGRGGRGERGREKRKCFKVSVGKELKCKHQPTHYLLADFKVQHVRVGDNGDSHIPLISIRRIVF